MTTRRVQIVEITTASWNVRGLGNTPDPDGNRSETKLKEIILYLEEFRVDICFLLETKHDESGLAEMDLDGWSFYHLRRIPRSSGGVTLAFRSYLAKFLDLDKKQVVTLVGCYMPTAETAKLPKSRSLYGQISAKLPKRHILLGDFNARVPFGESEISGRFGSRRAQSANMNTPLFTEFLKSKQSTTLASRFRHRLNNYGTWLHANWRLDSKSRYHQIDHIVASKNMLASCKDCRTVVRPCLKGAKRKRRTFDINTDHKLIKAKFSTVEYKWFVKKRPQNLVTRIPTKASAEDTDQYNDKISQLGASTDICAAMAQAGRETFGSTPERKPWISEEFKKLSS